MLRSCVHRIKKFNREIRAKFPRLINIKRRRGPILRLIMQSILHNREKKRGKEREERRDQFYLTRSPSPLKYKSQFQLTPAVFTHSLPRMHECIAAKIRSRD